MAWVGWFKFGDTLIANNEMSRGVAESFSRPFNWFTGPRYSSVQPALDPDISYNYANIQQMPWYDPSIPESANFFGVYCLGVTGLPDSTRQVAVIENILEGGSLGIPRRGTRNVVMNLLLTSQGRDALEYGFEWLDAVIDSTACGMHGNICGMSDLEFYSDVPPIDPNGNYNSDPTYSAQLLSMQRWLHGVGAIDGPHVSQELESGPFNAYFVTLTLNATRPYVYTTTTDLQLPPQIPIVVQDIPYNLEPAPSMELTDGTTPTVATNYVTNPSVETDTTGWAAATTTVSGTSPASYFTSGRVTGELSSVGNSSYRLRVLGNGSTAVNGEALLTATQTADLTAVSGTAVRPSVTVWCALIISAGASGSTLKSIDAKVNWLNSGGTVLRTDTLGSVTSGLSGHVFSQSSMVGPTGWAKIQVQVDADVLWASSATPANNSDIRFYVDAMGVTVP